MHSAHGTVSGSGEHRKCESVSLADICREKRKLRSDKVSDKFFHIPSRFSLELERAEKSDNDSGSEQEVFIQFHEKPESKQHILRGKTNINRPFSDSQITSYSEFGDYRTHISPPESESSEATNYSDLGEHLIAADQGDLDELELLETEINLARPPILNLMNVNPPQGQFDGQGAAAQAQAVPPAVVGAPVVPAAAQGPVLPVQQPLAAQVAANAQMFFPAVNMLSEERMLCPAPFSGRADEDATEFWRRFQNYLEFKPIVADADKLRLVKAMCIDQAADWADKLEPSELATFNAFKQAFEARWVKPALLKFRSAREMFTKKQMPEESVDNYSNRIRKLANRIDASDETLRYAFVSGLRLKIASFVLSKEPDTMNKALDAARVAEMSLGEAQESENNELSEQLTEIRRDLKRMAEKYDSISPSAPIQNERTRSPNRRVTFEGVRGSSFRPRSPSPGYDRRQDTSYAYQARTNFGNIPMQMPRGGGRGRSIGTRSFGRGARGGQSFNPQWRGNFGGQQFAPQFPPMGGQPANQRCQKCGGARHANVLFCPANGKMCMSCGKFGHFAKVCRQSRIQQA